MKRKREETAKGDSEDDEEEEVSRTAFFKTKPKIAEVKAEQHKHSHNKAPNTNKNHSKMLIAKNEVKLTEKIDNDIVQPTVQVSIEVCEELQPTKAASASNEDRQSQKRKRTKTRSKQKNIRKDNRPAELRPTYRPVTQVTKNLITKEKVNNKV